MFGQEARRKKFEQVFALFANSCYNYGKDTVNLRQEMSL